MYINLIKIKGIFSLVILLLLGTNAISQNLYKVEYNLTLNSPFSGSEVTFVQYSIRFNSDSNNYQYYFDGVTTNESNTLTRDLVVNLNFNPDTINLEALTFGAGPIPCEFPSRIDTPYNSNTDITFLPITDSGCAIPISNGTPLVMARIDGLEVLNISQGPNQLFNCESRVIKTLNSSSFSMSYKVEYQIGSNTSTWTTLLPYGRRSPDFEIDASDFSGLSSDNPNLRLRVSYDESNTNQSRSILSLTFAQCSPEIIDLVVENPICSYDDGEFTVTFDRPLIDGEVLTNIGVYKDTNDNGVPDILSGVDVFTGAIPDSAMCTGTTFTYPQTLPPGNYFFRYQSDNSNSAEISNLFTIEAPPPLQYNIEITNVISCFDTQDGEITITINPNTNGSIGTPPYFYTINSGALIPFEGMNTSTIVSGLGTDALEIKVFDSKGCTQRI